MPVASASPLNPCSRLQFLMLIYGPRRHVSVRLRIFGDGDECLESGLVNVAEMGLSIEHGEEVSERARPRLRVECGRTVRSSSFPRHW